MFARLRRPSPALVVACIALVVAVTGVGIAAIPATDGTIDACYAPRDGNELRVIDRGQGQRCKTSEKPLSWSQRGPTGPAGARGATGLSGASGVTVEYAEVPADVAPRTLASIPNIGELRSVCTSQGPTTLAINVTFENTTNHDVQSSTRLGNGVVSPQTVSGKDPGPFNLGDVAVGTPPYVRTVGSATLSSNGEDATVVYVTSEGESLSLEAGCSYEVRWWKLAGG